MYDLMDRPVAQLDTFERDILSATRRWVHAMSALGAPRVGADDPFGVAMHALNDGSPDDLAIRLPCHASVGGTEAVLLGLWRLVRDGEHASARATATLIVDPSRADVLLGAMRRLVRA